MTMMGALNNMRSDRFVGGRSRSAGDLRLGLLALAMAPAAVLGQADYSSCSVDPSDATLTEFDADPAVSCAETVRGPRCAAGRAGRAAVAGWGRGGWGGARMRAGGWARKGDGAPTAVGIAAPRGLLCEAARH